MNLHQEFDKLGIIAFLFFTIEAAYSIYRGHREWHTYLRLVVALAGLIIDTYLVFFV